MAGVHTEQKLSYKDLPALWHLFGCYFHEDWLEDVSTSADAFDGTIEPPDGLWRRMVDRYISESTASSTHMAARELDSVLAQPTSEAELEELLLVGLRSSYFPGRGNVRTWLQAVREHLERLAKNAT